MTSATSAMEAFLEAHAVISVDTMVLIYHLEDHPDYAPITQRIFAAWESGQVQGVISVVSLLELLVHPLRVGREDVAADYQELLEHFPNLSTRPVTTQVAVEAARLRANHGLRAADAIIGATALEAGATGFVTNDRALQRVRGVDIFVLDDAKQYSGRSHDEP